MSSFCVSRKIVKQFLSDMRDWNYKFSVNSALLLCASCMLNVYWNIHYQPNMIFVCVSVAPVSSPDGGLCGPVSWSPPAAPVPSGPPLSPAAAGTRPAADASTHTLVSTQSTDAHSHIRSSSGLPERLQDRHGEWKYASAAGVAYRRFHRARVNFRSVFVHQSG